MKPFRVGAGMLLLAVAGIQLIPRAPENSTATMTSSFGNVFRTPDSVLQPLIAVCFDCHSDHTRYPWYSRLQPVNGFMAQHVKKGKEKLNFDAIAHYGVRRQRAKFSGIVNVLQDGTMPLRSYTLLHRKLTETEKTMLIRYFTELKNAPGSDNLP